MSASWRIDWNPGVFECLIRQQTRHLSTEDLANDPLGGHGVAFENPSDNPECLFEISQLIQSHSPLRTRRSTAERKALDQGGVKLANKVLQSRPSEIVRWCLRSNLLRSRPS